MVTAVRPKSGLDWAIEIPESLSWEFPEDRSTSGFNQILYNVALAGRFGFENVPKSLPLIEQALLANFHSLQDNLKRIHPENPDKNVQQYISELGQIFYLYLRIAITEPQVGHFIGNGKEGNDEDAERWQHAGH